MQQGPPGRLLFTIAAECLALLFASGEKHVYFALLFNIMETILIILLIFSIVLILLSIEYFFNTLWVCPFLWILAELISLMGTFFLMEYHVSPIFGMYSTLPNPEHNQLSSTYPYFSTAPIPSDATAQLRSCRPLAWAVFWANQSL